MVSDLGVMRHLCRPVVLVDHAVEDLVPPDRQVQGRVGLAVLIGRSLLAGLVRAVPVGEEFLDMESDDLAGSGLDRFLGKMTEDADTLNDLHDAFGNVTESVHDLRLPGPVPGSGHAYEGQPVHEPMPLAEPGFSDLVGSAAIVGVAALTAFRYWMGNRREGDRQ